MPYISDGTGWSANASGGVSASSIWAALGTEALPVPTLHANAGVGAQIALGGVRSMMRATITPGTSPTQGGILATFALSNYTVGPVVIPAPCDPNAALARPYAYADANTLTLAVLGEIFVGVSMTFNLLVMGI